MTVRCIDWRVSSGEERCMTAAAGDWFAVPRRGRVEEAVGVALEGVRGAGGARDRRRGMIVAAYWGEQSRTGKSGRRQTGRIATASDSPFVSPYR